MIEKKTDIVRRLVSEGDYKQALSIVKGFRLGITCEESGQMVRAYECYVNPAFYKQLGRDTDTEILAGIKILESLYGSDVTH